jgi:hypothetical protein
MAQFWKKKPNRHPKVIPPAIKSLPTIPKPELIKTMGPKFYIPPDGTRRRDDKPALTSKKEASNLVISLPQTKPGSQMKRSQYSKQKPDPTLDHEKEFLRIFKQLAHMTSYWEVWKDFVTMFACTISNAVDKLHHEEREALFLRCHEKYKESDQKLFPLLVDEVIEALEKNPEQDFLGKLFMILDLRNHSKAQIFTPYDVCKLMAKISMPGLAEEIREKGYIIIDDPCCGSGATLIAAINTAKKILEKEGLNFQKHVLVTGQDIDATVAFMCYIQLSLLGMAGYIKIGNTLTEPMVAGESVDNYWFMPIYFDDVWVTRRLLKKMDDLISGKE